MRTFGVTPIHRLRETLNSNTFYIKRDDLMPFSFGGNKARKAILFFQDLEAKKCDCVVTYGSSSSNHCRVVANMAASKDIGCYIVSPQEASTPTINSKMTNLFGAQVTYCPVATVSSTIDIKITELREHGYNPYFIMGGGHGLLGTQAYVNAYKEIVEYERANNLHFDYIFHASGTGTTQAGLICGQILHGDSRNIVGISNARRNPYGAQVVFDSVNEYLQSVGEESISVEQIAFVDDYVLSGYGSYNAQILRTIQTVLLLDGIPLDVTYTGKAFWGMQEYIKKHAISHKSILFIHTGGTPLFFDDFNYLI